MTAPATAPLDPRDVLRQDVSILKKLVAYAYKKRGDALLAGDDASEAVARVLEGKGWYRWDPDAKSLLNHLAGVVDTVVANARRRAAVRRERPLKTGDDDGEGGGDDAPISSQNPGGEDMPDVRAARDAIAAVLASTAEAGTTPSPTPSPSPTPTRAPSPSRPVSRFEFTDT
jgi:hypothetical protein